MLLSHVWRYIRYILSYLCCILSYALDMIDVYSITYIFIHFSVIHPPKIVKAVCLIHKTSLFWTVTYKFHLQIKRQSNWRMNG